MNISTFRRRAGLSQAQLASLLGIAPNTLARWERGEIRPSPNARARLEQVMAGALAPLHGLRRAARRMNPTEPGDPTASLPALAAAARAARIPLVIVGGLAVVAHGVRRLTDDADVLGPDRETLADYLAGGAPFGLRLVDVGPIPQSPWSRAAMSVGSIGVEAILAEDEFLQQASLRARSFPRVPGKVIAVEDLLLMKLAASREKDVLDALSLMREHAARLDTKHVRRWAERLGILDRWRDLKRDYEAGARGW